MVGGGVGGGSKSHCGFTGLPLLAVMSPGPGGMGSGQPRSQPPPNTSRKNSEFTVLFPPSSPLTQSV